MSELRKDYFLDKYVIIASARGKRPHDFSAPKQDAPDPKKDPFHPDNRHMLPRIVRTWNFQGKEDGLLLTPNKFAITQQQGDPQLHTHNTFFTFAEAFGQHYVLIEGYTTGAKFCDFSSEEITHVLRAYQETIAQMYDEGARYVVAFKNEGRQAGASINHPHSQFVSLQIVPPMIRQLYAAYAELYDHEQQSPVLSVLEKEQGGARIIKDTAHWVSLCPYASAHPFETMFIPKRPVQQFSQHNQNEIADLAEHLKQVVDKLGQLNVSYNLEIISSDGNEPFHSFLLLRPRTTIQAGFELISDIIVNPMPPAQAAEFLRE